MVLLTSQLIDILEEQIIILKNLLKVSSEKTEALTNGNIDQIYEIISKEEQIKLSMEDIEKVRGNIIIKIAQKFDITSTVIVLSDIINNCDSKLKEKLILMQKEIHVLIQNYIEINQLNSALINYNLKFVGSMIETLASNQNAPVLYGQKGCFGNNSTQNHIFDNRA